MARDREFQFKSSAIATPTASEEAPVFPSTWGASLKHWWSPNVNAQASIIKRALDNQMPLLLESDDKPTEGKRAILKQVKLGAKGKDYLNCLEIGQSKRDPAEHNILVLHGYGGGLAFYFQQLLAFSSVPNTRVWFVDLLGMGLSSRPKFPSIRVKGTSREQTQQRVSQAEDFFVNSLEEFRQKEGIDRWTMIAHSLGAYASTGYAIKHPDRVNKLVLLSPAGVPRSPYEIAEGEEISVESKGNEKTFSPKPTYPKTWWSRLWEMNVSPFSIARNLTFLGPMAISRYATRRYAAFDKETQKDLYDYLYQIWTAKGSGEYCLAHVLAPGAHARWPLIDRIDEVKCPVSFSYGDKDWMEEKGGRDCVDKIKSSPIFSELQKRRSKHKIIRNAGHWLFLDNPKDSNEFVVNEIKEAVQDAQASK